MSDYHECAKCGRKLKDKKSIERGYGPVCWMKARENPDLVDMLREGDNDEEQAGQSWHGI